MRKNYTDLTRLTTLEDRYNYLKLSGDVGDRTFGGHRYLNQNFYTSKEWKTVRNRVIARDGGNELGLDGYPIKGEIFVHHISPIALQDVLQHSDILLDENNLISVSADLHNAIHYGVNFNELFSIYELVERKPNDTCPWKGGGVKNGGR